MSAFLGQTTAEVSLSSYHPGHRGSGIAVGRDEDGELFRVLISHDVLSRAPAVGETWRFTGNVEKHEIYGDQLVAAIALPLIPRGEMLVRFLALNKAIPGVGWKTAEHIWATFGAETYDILKNRDQIKLADLVGHEIAGRIFSAFGLLAIEVEVFEWLDRYGVAPRTASRAASIWGRSAIDKIKNDPYTLNLLEPWQEVDARALRLGILPHDKRRLMAASEEATAQAWARGHTCLTRCNIVQSIRLLLNPASDQAEHAFNIAVSEGILIAREGNDGVWQSRAAFAMERTVEEKVSARVTAESTETRSEIIAAAIAEVEAETGHALTDQQRKAVKLGTTAMISAISGGAGTGKTTILRAMLRVLEKRSRPGKGKDPVWQIAVSGRAAKRMREATGGETMTVHSFLKQLEMGKLKQNRGLLIVDEASMIDLPSAYRVLTEVPCNVAICWVGDAGQLPPIGPGLFFHRLTTSKTVPSAELDRIHRQSTESSIPSAAAAVRSGNWIDIPTFDANAPFAEGVWLAPCGPSETLDATLKIWRALAGPAPAMNEASSLNSLRLADVQIICPVRNGSAGAKEVSAAIERDWMAHQRSIRNLGVSVGSRLLWIRNDYDRPTKRVDVDGNEVKATLMNGTLGAVSRGTSEGAIVAWDDGQELEIREPDLKKLERGWAITVHKAQGSAWDRIVVPLTRSRLLDRTLVYTAMTRAKRSVIFVGSRNTLREAIEAPAVIDRRHVALSFNAS